MKEFKVGDRVTISDGNTTITTTLGKSSFGPLVQSAPQDINTADGFALKGYISKGWVVEEAKPLLPTVPGSVIRYSDDFFVLTEAGNWASEYDTWKADDFEDDPEFTVIFVNTKIVEDAPVEDA